MLQIEIEMQMADVFEDGDAFADAADMYLVRRLQRWGGSRLTVSCQERAEEEEEEQQQRLRGNCHMKCSGGD